MISEILNGWKNYFVMDPVVEEVAKKRAEICSSCPSAKHGLHAALLKDGTLKDIVGKYCGECGCPLSTKVRSETSKCPKGKWQPYTKS